MANTELFQKKQYINLETFRKNGEGVKTPVWFVEYQDQLVVITEAGSGKTKRIRNHPQVRVAPCTVNGALLGDWIPATARFLQENEGRDIDRLFNRKYGLMKFLFELPNLFRKKTHRAFLAITLTQSSSKV